MLLLFKHLESIHKLMNLGSIMKSSEGIMGDDALKTACGGHTRYTDQRKERNAASTLNQANVLDS